MMSRSCGCEIKSILKVISSSKVEARNKSGRSFAQFYTGAEIPPGVWVCLSFGTFVQCDNIHTSSETGAFNVHFWQIYLGKIYFAKILLEKIHFQIQYLHLIWDRSFEYASVLSLFWNIFTPSILFIVNVIIFVPHLRLELWMCASGMWWRGSSSTPVGWSLQTWPM